MKTIQEQNREFIIMANNPEAKTYAEALEMELSFGCIVKTEFPFTTRLCFNNKPFKELSDLWKEEGGFWVSLRGEKDTDKNIIPCSKIIGKPLTLNRVLIAFKNNEDIHYYTSNDIFYIALVNQDPDDQIEWDLTKETLEEQSEEMQIAINEMILD